MKPDRRKYLASVCFKEMACISDKILRIECQIHDFKLYNLGGKFDLDDKCEFKTNRVHSICQLNAAALANINQTRCYGKKHNKH